MLRGIGFMWLDNGLLRVTLDTALEKHDVSSVVGPQNWELQVGRSGRLQTALLTALFAPNSHVWEVKVKSEVQDQTTTLHISYTWERTSADDIRVLVRQACWDAGHAPAPLGFVRWLERLMGRIYRLHKP